MGAHTRDLLRLTERILLMKEDAAQLLARTTDRVERMALAKVQAPLNDALCILDIEHNAELDAAEEARKAERQRRDAVLWAKSIREFPPELYGTMFRNDKPCPGCGKVELLGQTTGQCQECWIKAGMP
jgi:hypothetical protein